MKWDGLPQLKQRCCCFLGWLAESSAVDLAVVAAEIVVLVVG
jgi:hypothetical protein